MRWRHSLWSRSILGLGGVLIALTVFLVSGTSVAQMTPSEQFAQGQTLFEKGEFEEALPFFQNAYERTQSPNASLYVARCLEKLKRYDEAYTVMLETVSLATEKANEDEKYASTRDAAAAELALLRPRVGLVVIAFAEEFVDALATLNDEPLKPEQLGVPVAVMPGMVTIVGSAPGHEAVSKTIEVGSGETKTVALALPQATETGPEEGGGGIDFAITPIRAAGFGVAGLGVVGLVVFAITGSMASSKFSQVETECGGQRCTDPAYAEVIDDGKTLSTVANVTAVLGGAALVAGVLMVILGGPDDATPSTSTALKVVPSPGGIGLGVSF